jgi:5'-3' exonuclease
MKIEKLHLLDGTYELFRHYYGAPKRQGPDGREIGATLGFLRSVLAMLRQPEVTHLACAFDTVVESFRNEMFDGYKTGEGIEAPLRQQFPLVERAAAALGVVVWPMERFEADDALATAAHRWAGEVGQVVLCSPDKDLAQCVQGRRIICLDRRRKVEIDEAEVEARHGVQPASIPDYLGLVGDSADGIPGLKGWGAKSAAAVLARFGHLEAIPEDPARWGVKVRGAQKLAATLREGREEALLYRQLAVLRTDVPLAESLEDLQWQGARREALEDLCREMGAEALLDRVPRWR